MLANQPDTVVADKEQKTTVLTDVAIPVDRNIWKREQDKTEKCQELKEQLKLMWEVKSKVFPVVTGALGTLPQK